MDNGSASTPSRFATAWRRLRTSLWLVPGIIVAGATVLAIVLIELDQHFGAALTRRWPGVFGAGAEGARAMLTAIAGSMITVAGVVFSITLVVLSSAASQYSPRVLRRFMTDRLNQSVLGVFVGIYAYCLVVLRTIRGTDEGAFVPALAVLGGVALAFVGVAYLIYFIHHVSVSIQASAIIAHIAEETTRSFQAAGPGHGGARADVCDGDGSLRDEPQPDAHTVCASTSGYLLRIDVHRLIRLACSRDLNIRIDREPGEFVMRGQALGSVTGVAARTSSVLQHVANSMDVGRDRSPDADPVYGLRQLTDIALKALSPGINDPTTARMAIDQLTSVFVELARLGPRRRSYFDRARPDCPRLRLRLVPYQILLRDSYGEIRQAATGNEAVLRAIVLALARLEQETSEVWRREALLREADALRNTLDLLAAHRQGEWTDLRRETARLVQRLMKGDSQPSGSR